MGKAHVKGFVSSKRQGLAEHARRLICRAACAMRAADVAHGRIEDLHTSKYKGIPLRVLQRMLPQRPGFAGVAEAAMSIEMRAADQEALVTDLKALADDAVALSANGAPEVKAQLDALVLDVIYHSHAFLHLRDTTVQLDRTASVFKPWCDDGSDPRMCINSKKRGAFIGWMRVKLHTFMVMKSDAQQEETRRRKERQVNERRRRDATDAEAARARAREDEERNLAPSRSGRARKAPRREYAHDAHLALRARDRPAPVKKI